jgi:hypothetical protein
MTSQQVKQIALNEVSYTNLFDDAPTTAVTVKDP